jgi:DNA-binding winged helix-turn-helix (wHTH) protein
LKGFRLGEWLIRPDDGSVASSAGSTRVEPQLMDLLVYLCSRAGQVVPKQDVLNAVWAGRFVSDESVKAAFYELRKALGDNPRQPRFIETLPKRGYRVLLQPAPVNTTVDTTYLKGREALAGEPSEAALKQARLYFERSIESDPSHAGSYSGLAHVYTRMVVAGGGSGAELWPRAAEAASHAIELNPELAEAHWVLGAVRFSLDYDFATAEAELRRAINLDPTEALARRWYARLLSAAGRHDEAVAEARRAVADEPLSLMVRRDLLETLLLARRYDEIITETRRIGEMAPTPPDVFFGMVWVYGLKNDAQRAFDSFAAGLSALGVAAMFIEHARRVFLDKGLNGLLELWAETLEREAQLGQRNQVDLAVLAALLGNHDRCFELLALLREARHPSFLMVRVSPLFDSIRSDPRYGNLFPTK